MIQYLILFYRSTKRHVKLTVELLVIVETFS